MIHTKHTFLSAAAVTLCAALLAGCGTAPGSDAGETSRTSAAETSASETSAAVTSASSEEQTSSAAPSASVGAFADEEEITPEKEEKPFVIAVDGINSTYTPFTGSSEYDRLLDRLTGARLLGRTRAGRPVTAGVSGQKERFGGKTYDYSGLADVFTYRSETDDTTTFTFVLRENAGFADGETLDADDVIFTLYVLLDPSYEGDKSLADAGIVGALNYRYDSAFADTITDERIAEVLASPEIEDMMREKLVIPTLQKQYAVVETLYGDSSYEIYTSRYPDPRDLFVFFFSIDSEYTRPENASKDDVISDIAAMYGSGYKQLASMTVGDENAFDRQAAAIATEYITVQSYNAEVPREHINSISGIRRTSRYSLAVTVRGTGTDFLDTVADIVVAPLHYYGSEALYEIEKERFGFTKGNAAAVLAAHAGDPLGAGAYSAASSDDGTPVFAANKYYYRGKPYTEEITVTGAYDDPADMIADGRADAAFSDGSADVRSSADNANRSVEKVFTEVVGSSGYGYIGINADTVNISGDALSEASCFLRKGIATALNYFKGGSVSAYFGEEYELTDYAIAGTMQVAADTEAYIPPYSLDADGEPILTPDMTAAQQKNAVKTACLGYFMRAGYTVDENGVITAAPEGGRLSFNALVSGGGAGAHPAYTALAKTSELLGEIGITLNVTDVTDPGTLWESISHGTHEIWAGAWDCTLSHLYPADHYGIDFGKLDYELPETESAADAEYALFCAVCRKAVDELAVEVPLYKRTSLVLFSALRVNKSGVAENMTGSYDWTDQIEKLELK